MLLSVTKMKPWHVDSDFCLKDVRHGFCMPIIFGIANALSNSAGDPFYLPGQCIVLQTTISHLLSVVVEVDEEGINLYMLVSFYPWRKAGFHKNMDIAHPSRLNLCTSSNMM